VADFFSDPGVFKRRQVFSKTKCDLQGYEKHELLSGLIGQSNHKINFNTLKSGTILGIELLEFKFAQHVLLKSCAISAENIQCPITIPSQSSKIIPNFGHSLEGFSETKVFVG
jgi:hypothetical protein